MKKMVVLEPITLSATVWTPITFNDAVDSIVLQCRTAADVYFADQINGRYWTLKSGSSLQFDCEGRSWQVTEDTTDLVKNGAFTGSAYAWTIPGAYWAYHSNDIHKSDDGTGQLSQVMEGAIVGAMYKITYTIANMTVASVRSYMGDCASPVHSLAATYSDYLRCGPSKTLSFIPANLSRFELDTVSVVRVDNLNLLALGSGAVVLEMFAIV